MRTLDFIENEMLRRDLPPFKVGDTVAVHVKVREGDKERIQVFQGLVIRRRGAGAGETFTVRKISSGVGVERVFPVQSPLVTKVEIKARGYVRRSRLYYLRNLSGKKARLHSKVRDLSGLISEEEAETLANTSDAPEAAPEVEAAPEATEEEAAKGGKKLKGKALKKAKAAEKAERMKKLKVEEAERAAQKAEEAASAEAEEAAADAGDDASDAPAEEAEESKD
ncbi:MAG: 50S ribosomal protein L19 [Deltaproteobacteria bacterium]|nr:50S ribosomal protein L19 [Deltaproteobacteria bacterium]